ncbi:pyruvate, water dikinase regulatory protein [Aquibacillus albus]|uniref:Putative pyruvate, phosphate dikinase regulatory protein n=1 Tax=Aquibacillus albus TaxID=1168171 RepID=A0ABS2MUQ7_9BACI|nr:pyruvate, water dikinase regulatory protein [Aquibacillus albus]MBM7569636.1 regulator of PEP synthase PpsR (kinase-PPPase family) [Aquibacillus albus]
MKKPTVFVISDSVGETAEFVIKAALSQFISDSDYIMYRFPYVQEERVLRGAIIQAKEQAGIIGFTLVDPSLRNYLIKEANLAKVECIDIMGPMMAAMERSFNQKPRLEPGLVHKLDEDYFKRVEAIEFAVRYDDGRDPKGITQADIVLIGVSRTSKTPLSQYLAHKRLKVANVPIVPEVEPPKQLFSVNPNKCVGLRISSEKLNDVRKERLKALGLRDQSSYANIDRINQELRHFQSIIDRIGCPVIDVSNKAVEETANVILNNYLKN